MIPYDVAALFIAASVALAFAPGPDNIFVMTQSALHGRLSGFVVTLGLCTGLIVHTSAVAFGVAAIFKTSEIAFLILKGIGAAYLLYLAWGAFRAGSSNFSMKSSEKPRLGRLYMRGIVMNVTNPKVAIFFLAFLPQFAEPERGALTLQIFLFGGLFMLSALVVFGGFAYGAGFLGDKLKKSSRAQSILNKLAGTVFVALAGRLLLAER